MIGLICRSHTFAYEMEHILRMFFPGSKVEVSYEQPIQPQECFVVTAIREQEPSLAVQLHFPELGEDVELEVATPQDKDLERGLAVLLYQGLSRQTGLLPPWGILTGVRPVRRLQQWQRAGLDQETCAERFKRDWLVQPEKVQLALLTADAQRDILNRVSPKRYSLYISIPFCPTRCLYCSFISHDIAGAAALLPDYLRLLERELQETAALANHLGLSLQTIYIGGGTPTSLNAAQLERLLKCIADAFDLSSLEEYTVEAGRPDTVDEEKLALFRRFGVDRISINPQTMDDAILRRIGRAHTAHQVEESYHLARNMGFSAINMDLIAGLPGESEESFHQTLERVLALEPENITLHTLTVKRSSRLRETEEAFVGTALELDNLLTWAGQRFAESGYRPYYLYRQKGTVQNLENTGFSKPGKEGVYNIYSMEEVHTILAVGAGAVTKLCLAGDIRRVYNFKYPYEYIGRFEEMLQRKAQVEEFYEKHSGKEIHTG